MVVVIPVGVLSGLLALLAAAVVAGDGGDDLIKIGELWNGRVEPKKWVPITRSKTAPQPVRERHKQVWGWCCVTFCISPKSRHSWYYCCCSVCIVYNSINSSAVYHSVVYIRYDRYRYRYYFERNDSADVDFMTSWALLCTVS